MFWRECVSRNVWPGWPDWDNFRPLDDCLLWTVFGKLQKFVVQNFWLLNIFHRTYYVLILTKYGLGYILGDFFLNSSGHPAMWPYRGFVEKWFAAHDFFTPNPFFQSGLPDIFPRTVHKNGKNIPNDHKLPKGCKMYQMVTKCYKWT
jgi:hypothetical protein